MYSYKYIYKAYVHAAQVGFITVADLTLMLSASISKLLESLKGEINPTARACAADVLSSILAACYNSGKYIFYF
jgi:hypothetical protein